MSSLKETQRFLRWKAADARMSTKTLAREVRRFMNNPPRFHRHLGYYSSEDALVGIAYADLAFGKKATRQWVEAALNAVQERHVRHRRKK